MTGKKGLLFDFQLKRIQIIKRMEFLMFVCPFSVCLFVCVCSGNVNSAAQEPKTYHPLLCSSGGDNDGCWGRWRGDSVWGVEGY